MGDRNTKRQVLRTLLLFVLWLLLSESFRPAHMAVGLACALIVALLSWDPSASRTYAVRWARALLFMPWLFGRIFLSGMHLAGLVLHPRLPIKPQLFRHRIRLENDDAVMLMGNSITLTPGTVTVEADPGELLVHALDDASTLDVTTGRLERKVGAVFGPGGDAS